MPAVKEPALIAIIGVGGVVVGAVGGGLVQSALARAERRRAGRAAAVVLRMELHDAEKAISDLRELRAWDEMITDWDAYAAIWALYRDRLASVLNTKAFAKVAAAFACLASLKRSYQRDTLNSFPQRAGTPDAESASVYRHLAGLWGSHQRKAQQPAFDPTDEYLALYLRTVQEAKRIVLKASFRWWEMRHREKALAEQGPPKAPTS
jgi:hypothetical protein